MKAKILIIGGGVMGTSIALKAAQRTDPIAAPVVLLEKSEIGAGSSGHSGAILRQHYSSRVVAAMARDSLREYASFEGRAGRSIGFHRSGVMTLAGPGNKAAVERIEANVAMLSEMGIKTKVVTSDEMTRLVPGIQVEPGAIGAWEPDAGFVEPRKTLQSFAALARTYGAVTRIGVEATGILVEGGRVAGVTTSEGDYEVEQLVLVAGPWTRALLETVGIEVPLRIVQPENVFIGMPHSDVEAEVEEDLGDEDELAFDIEEDPTDATAGEQVWLPRGMHPVLIDVERGFYSRCEPRAGRTWVGRVDYAHDAVLAKPEDRTEKVSQESHEWAHQSLSARIPSYAPQKSVGEQTSWYTLTPDSQPIIGPVPGIEGLFVAAGFSGHGFKLGPAVGEGVAQMLFDEAVSAFDPDFFAPDRFKGKPDWSGGSAFGL